MKRLLPGYVFFEASCDQSWQSALMIPGVIRILKYGDGDYALHEADLYFVEWLKENEGLIEPSQVVRIGTKIKFVGGPLLKLGGSIKKVNKNRKHVLVSIGDQDSFIREVWCPIEYVDSV